jgi:uncharacterized membrane protein HdeD (DUF308 family)
MAANRLIDDPVAGIKEIRRSWGWFLALGIALMLFGAICIAGTIDATLATVLVFGWLLLITGIMGLIHSFRARSASGFFLFLLSALFRGFIGCLLICYPAASAAALTLTLASFFIVGGLFRSVGASTLKLPRWGWSVFSGVVSCVLGILLLVEMPASSIWFIGFALGVDMLLDGASLVALAVATHRLHNSDKAEATAT